jgi:hypothetical protein
MPGKMSRKNLSVIPEEGIIMQFPDDQNRKIDTKLQRALESLRTYEEQKKKFSNKIARLLEEQDEETEEGCILVKEIHCGKKNLCLALKIEEC